MPSRVERRCGPGGGVGRMPRRQSRPKNLGYRCVCRSCPASDFNCGMKMRGGARESFSRYVVVDWPALFASQDETWGWSRWVQPSRSYHSVRKNRECVWMSTPKPKAHFMFPNKTWHEVRDPALSCGAVEIANASSFCRSLLHVSRPVRPPPSR